MARPASFPHALLVPIPRAVSSRLRLRISDIQAFPYELPLVDSLDLGGGRSIRLRRGILVRISVSNEREEASGWGDVAPLPGFSSETLDDAHRSVTQCARTLDNVRVDVEDDRFPAPLHDADPDAEQRPPSVRFGFEQALATSIAGIRGTNLSDLLSARASILQLNALLTGTPDAMRRRAEAIYTGPGGYQTVKVKVGRNDLQDEARLVHSLYDRWGEDVSLRLDANRAWSFDEAVQFARAVQGVPIEYIEEPLQHPRELSRFADDTELPVALDETTRELPLDRWLDAHYASAFVIKPMLIGFSATLDLHRRLASSGAENDRPSLVISSAYESGVGLAGLAVLAAAVHRPGSAAGLDTYRALDRDVLTDRLPITGSSVDVQEWSRRITDAQLSSVRLGPSLDL